jgi:hypothetical protein
MSPVVLGGHINVVQDDRYKTSSWLDSTYNACVKLFLYPAVRNAELRQDYNEGVGTADSLLEGPLNEAIAWRDLPTVKPGINTARPEFASEARRIVPYPRLPG